MELGRVVLLKMFGPDRTLFACYISYLTADNCQHLDDDRF